MIEIPCHPAAGGFPGIRRRADRSGDHRAERGIDIIPDPGISQVERADISIVNRIGKDFPLLDRIAAGLFIHRKGQYSFKLNSSSAVGIAVELVVFYGSRNSQPIHTGKGRCFRPIKAGRYMLPVHSGHESPVLGSKAALELCPAMFLHHYKIEPRRRTIGTQLR